MLIHIPSEAVEGRIFHSACFCDEGQVTLFHPCLFLKVDVLWVCEFNFSVKALPLYCLILASSELFELGKVGLMYVYNSAGL